MLLNTLTYHAPKNALEAAKLYTSLEDVKILAGGTFLLNSLKTSKRKGRKTPKNILSLRKATDLKGVSLEGKNLVIRAMTTVNELFDSELLTGNFRLLRTVCQNISTNPIRNMATVGGNLTCRYTWTEFGAAMIALDATMHFLGPDGKEESVSVENFFKNAARNDKIFTHISVPQDNDASIVYRRVKKTVNVDVPLLAICIRTNFKNDKFVNTRVAVNNGVAFAQRDTALENFLNSSVSNNGVATDAMDHLTTAIYDTRSDEYKKNMFRISIESAIRELLRGRQR